MKKTALKYTDKEGKRVIFRGAENFGKGSYDKAAGKHIVPVLIRGEKPLDGGKKKYQFFELFEN